MHLQKNKTYIKNKKMEESEDIDKQIREGNRRLRERRAEQNE